MATLSPNQFTLLDLARLPANEDAADVINLLAQFNPMLQHAPALPCNMGHEHKTTVLTGLPSVTWGKLYKGIAASKGLRQSVKDSTGFVESASEVDTRILKVHETAEEKASVREQEAMAHIEAMSQEAASALIYHDTQVDPEKPMGFAPRFNDLSAENGGQIIDAGGVGSDNTSVWMINWSPLTCHLIFPKGYKAGLDREDQGNIPVQDANGNTYHVAREVFTWHLGLTVRDWRYVSRVANIDVSDLSIDASTGADLIFRMTQAYYKNYGRRVSLGQTKIYCNSDIVEYLDHQARNVPDKLRTRMSEDGVNAQEVLMFRKFEVVESDAILGTESQVA